MANFIYGKAKESLLNGQFNISSDSLKVLLVTQSYVPNQNTDQFVSNISGSYIKQRTSSLTNVTNTLGVIDADNILVSNYDGSAFKALVIYKDSGTDATSRLLAYIDTATGIPFLGINATTDITINWSNGSNKIISL
jgi:S1-C subfamily serine protease